MRASLKIIGFILIMLGVLSILFTSVIWIIPGFLLVVGITLFIVDLVVFRNKKIIVKRQHMIIQPVQKKVILHKKVCSNCGWTDNIDTDVCSYCGEELNKKSDEKKAKSSDASSETAIEPKSLSKTDKKILFFTGTS